jgi:hypothetical protein
MKTVICADVLVLMFCVAYCFSTVQPNYCRWLFLGTFANLGKATISFVMFARPSVCLSAWNSSAPTVRIFMEFDVYGIFRKSVEKIKVSLKSDKNDGYFT